MQRPTTTQCRRLALIAVCASAVAAAAGAGQIGLSGAPSSEDARRAGTGAQKLLRLAASPNRVSPGDAVTVTGTDFGDAADGRGLDLMVAGAEKRVTRYPMKIERWSSKAIQARVPTRAPAQADRAMVLLVDAKRTVLGRASLVLGDRAGSSTSTDTRRRSVDRTGAGEPYPGERRSEKDSGPDKLGRADRGQRVGAGRSGSSGSSDKRPDTGAGRARDDRRVDRGQDTRVDPGADRGQESKLDPRGSEARERSRVGRDSTLGEGASGRRKIPPDGGGSQLRLPVRHALALGGGGAKGAFQVGVLKNLYARGLQPVIITGTSVGALNAAKLAEGPSAISDLVAVWRDIAGNNSIYVENPHLTALTDPNDPNSAARWFGDLSHIGFDEAQEALKLPSVGQKVTEALMDFNAMDGFFLQRGLATKVAQNLSPRAVARSGIKLRMTAIERVSGDLRYFTENGDIEMLNGSIWKRGRSDGADMHDVTVKAPTVADGVMASAAIPLFFAPWLVQGGEYYWDGAVREGIPIRKALELGATDLVAILTGPRERLTTSTPGRYTLTIERVRRVGDDNPDAGSSGDYFARAKWGHREWKRTGYYEDKSSVSPNWRFEDVMGDIQIEVKDFDSPDADDACDASPARGRTRLEINFDPRRFTNAQNPDRYPIQGDGQGQIGDLITVAGAGERDRVEVWLRITPGVPGASGYTKSLPVDLAPLVQAMSLITHQGSEVSRTDLCDLDVLDALHEVAGELNEGAVVRGVKSFPLPKDDLGRPYMVPTYVLIEPPFLMGELQEFDAEAISFNIELGDTVARWTRVDFLDRGPARYDLDGRTPIPTQRPEADDEAWLERMKRSAILGLLTNRIDTWRRREQGGDDGARIWREKYEALQRKANDLQIVPPRHSPRRAADR